jgi:hypothetical protein
MEYYYIRFAIEWIIWFMFADKKRWREIFPVCIFAGFLGSLSDSVMHQYSLWMFDYGISVIPDLLDDLGTYIVFTYLFIQWLPGTRTFLLLFGYFFLWTIVALVIEYIHLKTGHMTFHKWWTIWYSYIADWILFWLIYKYYHMFRFERLSNR